MPVAPGVQRPTCPLCRCAAAPVEVWDELGDGRTVSDFLWPSTRARLADGAPRGLRVRLAAAAADDDAPAPDGAARWALAEANAEAVEAATEARRAAGRPATAVDRLSLALSSSSLVDRRECPLVAELLRRRAAGAAEPRGADPDAPAFYAVSIADGGDGNLAEIARRVQLYEEVD